MSRDRVSEESEVTENRTVIPPRVRRELGVDDGDRLRWVVEPDECVRVDVVSRRTGTFAGFEGSDGDAATDVIDEHGTWGVE